MITQKQLTVVRTKTLTLSFLMDIHVRYVVVRVLCVFPTFSSAPLTASREFAHNDCLLF